jgi:diguanylate cyclase (GGDEF)-like protein
MPKDNPHSGLFRLSAVYLYVLAISIAGAALLLALPWLGRGTDPVSVKLIVLGPLAVLGEMFPISVRWQGETDEITTSSAFTFALLLWAGLVPAVIAQTAASLIGDAVRRKPPWKAVFNAAQYAVSLGASAFALVHLTDATYAAGLPAVSPGRLPAVLGAATSFYLVNVTLIAVAVALSQRVRIIPHIRRELALQGLTEAVLLTLSPVLVLISERSLWFVLLVVLPMVAVHQNASVSLERIRLVGRLQDSLADIQEMNRLNEYQALHDSLTDLPNRSLFNQRVHEAIASMAEGGLIAVMIMDLDRFKDINDTLGHQSGDILLQQVGSRLRTTMREGDTVSRLGGDEFGVLLRTCRSVSDALQTAKRVQAALSGPFLVQGLQIEIESSMGVSVFPEHGSDPELLLQRADLAMYVAKGGRHGVQLYSSDHDQFSPSRLVLLGELRRAIEEEQLVVYYQPKVSIHPPIVVGVEALVRWQHPARGLLGPDEFIPFVEHTTLLRPLTHYVLDAALAQLSAWRLQGLHLSVSVNLSARDLVDLHLPEEVEELLDQWQLNPESLTLELTETNLMSDHTRGLEVLNQLHELGVGLALDDFGTGYSSLARLRRLPVDELKIDKGFVLNMTKDDSDEMIVRSTIDLGRNLGLRVVAEGVESEGVWKRLAELGCDEAQGYYLSRPVPAPELRSWFGIFPERFGQHGAQAASEISTTALEEGAVRSG